MKKVLMILVVLVAIFTLSGCYLDLDDPSHDDDFVLVSNYFERIDGTLEVVERYYLPKIDGELVFYELDIEALDLVSNTTRLTYQFRGNYKVESEEPLNIYMLSELKWVNITENDYIYSENKLEDDVLVEYGTLPIIANDYEIGNTIRVIYQENNIYQHYYLQRTNNYMYIRYGDIRGLLNNA